MRRADFAITPSPPPPAPAPGPSPRTKGGKKKKRKKRERTGKENACWFIKIRKAVATVLGVVKGDGASVS